MREREYTTVKGGMRIDCIVGVLLWLGVTETLSRWEAEEVCGYAVTMETPYTLYLIRLLIYCL